MIYFSNLIYFRMKYYDHFFDSKKLFRSFVFFFVDLVKNNDLKVNFNFFKRI